MIVLYFTATGNSLAVAKAVGGTLRSIPQLIEKNEYTIEDEVIGIIVPCFGFSLPRLVSKYFAKATLQADYIFAGITSASMPGNALGELNRLLKGRGAALDYGRDLIMMNNYLVWSAMEKELALLPAKDVDGQLQDFIRDIAAHKKYLPPKSLVSKLLTYVADYSRSSWSSANTSNFDKKFIVDDQCTGCKICEKVCPAGNIQVEKTPVFLHRCEGCLACIHHCPAVAIHYVKEKSAARFRNENVSLAEIIAANKRV